MSEFPAHPGREQLREYLLGGLSDDQSSEVGEHLDTCVQCETTVADLDGESDDLLRQLGTVKDAGHRPVDAHLQRVLELVSGSINDTPMLHGDVTPVPRRIGEYELIEKIGEGGMGAVYRARHLKLDKTVALKVLPDGKLQKSHAVSRFEREMRAIGKLDHPNLVRASDAGEIDGIHYLVMEYLNGCDLGKLSRQLGPLPINDACEIIRQAALGIHEAHNNGLIHRDVKPSNLILTTRGQIKVLDLGLALIADAPAAVDALTCSGQVMGTIDYMAPEQSGNSHAVGPLADVYSLGATLYKLLVGQPPLGNEQTPLLNKLSALALKVPSPANNLRAEVPQALATLIASMLDKAPDRRPSTGAAIAEALAPFATNADLERLYKRFRQSSSSPNEQSAALVETQCQLSTVHSSQNSATETTPTLPFLKAAPPSRRKPPIGYWVGGIGGAGALLLGVIMFLIPARDGFIQITVDDPSIQVMLDQNGATITESAKKGIRVEPGMHGLIIRHNDTELHTEKFTIQRGDRMALAIEFRRGDLQVIQADGKLVPVARKIPELPPEKPLAPVVTQDKPETPNVVPALATPERPLLLVRNDKTVRAFRQFAGIFAEMQAGDVIVIHSNDRYKMDSQWPSTPVVDIRAGEGYRPTLEFIPGQPAVSGSLRLTSCDLDLDTGFVDTQGPLLEIANCRLHGYLLFSSSEKVVLRNSILMTGTAGNVFRNVQHILVENCLIHGQGEVLLLQSPHNVKVVLRNSTFFQETHGTGSVVGARSEQKAEVEATGNLFHVNAQAELFTIPNWRTTVKWSGRDNLYSANPFIVTNDKGEFVRVGKIEDWNAIWKRPEEGSRFVEQAEPAFVKLTTADWNALRSEIEPHLLHARETYGKPDLGPQLDRIGAGKPYEDRLREELKAEPEMRPEVLSGGPIILVRDNKEVAGFQTIMDALATAEDNDILELRTDVQLPHFMIDSPKPRFLTIRGAPGYKAAIQGLNNFGKDILSLENLVLEGQVLGTRWHSTEGLKGEGGIHRMRNCTARFNCVNLASRFVSHNNLLPQIESCRLVGLAIDSDESTPIKISNSVMLRLIVGDGQAPAGPVTLDHCCAWNLEPIFAWRHHLGDTYSSLFMHSRQKVQTTHCYFVAPEYLISMQNPLGNDKLDWTGEQNVFSVSNAFLRGIGVTELHEWEDRVSSEVGSVTEKPLLFDPRLWTLSPGSVGQGEGPGGRDYGADIELLRVELSLK